MRGIWLNRLSVLCAIRYVVSGFLIVSAVQAKCQFTSFQFSDSLDGIFNQVDFGDFLSASEMLAAIDSTTWSAKSVARADFYFTRGYYNLFSSGKMESLDDFVRAGRIYLNLEQQRKMDLVDVHLVVDLYVKSQWDDSKRRAHEMLQRLSLKEKELRAILHNVLAACYCGFPPDKPQGHFHGDAAIKFFKEHQNNRRLISLYGILAACGSEDEASASMSYIDSAIYHAEKINHKKQLAFLNIRKARALKTDGKFDEALVELADAKIYFENNPTEQGQLGWINTITAQIYADKNDFKKAYQVLENQRVESVNQRSQTADLQINQLMVKYETAQKENEIAMQKLVIANKNGRIRNQKIIASAVILAIASFFGLVFWRYKQRQIDRRRVDALNHQRKLLDNTISTVEKERKRIAQDLHDGIGQKLTGLKMAWQQLTRNSDAVDTKDVSYLTSILDETSTDIRHISHKLMPASLRKLGLAPAIEDCLEQTLTSAEIAYSFDHYGLEQRFSETIEVGVYRVLQELLNNIIKHAGAEKVDVELFKSNNQLVFLLSDDGCGFDLEANRNSGNGLYNIESRVKSMEGIIEFENKPNVGMTVSFRLPIRDIK